MEEWYNLPTEWLDENNLEFRRTTKVHKGSRYFATYTNKENRRRVTISCPVRIPENEESRPYFVFYSNWKALNSKKKEGSIEVIGNSIEEMVKDSLKKLLLTPNSELRRISL